jgi:mono/diheme cytochrome c family protein
MASSRYPQGCARPPSGKPTQGHPFGAKIARGFQSVKAIGHCRAGIERFWLLIPFGLTALGLVLPIGVLPAGAVEGQAESARKVDYNREVRPILAGNCFACHGQDEAKRAKGLSLDRRDSAVKPLKNGNTAIVPRDPDSSELIVRVTEGDDTLRMPPRKAGNRLAPAEIDVLRRWIEQGAEYAPHWAFLAPKAQAIPKVADKTWPRNGIDFWILDRLQKEGLKSSSEASRPVLLRRLSLDLRGLPPTLEEIEGFVADQSGNAYEKVVDRFLADPAYGERWARMWLDQARYADSAGYGSDPLRPSIWRYRDWVVASFNHNLPFDQFTLWQTAGDLLPEATLEQKIATAFHRNTMTNTEGGTDDEEFRVAAIKDRVDTTMQVFMGLTMGCAKCHTHKFDPITHEEYYKFYAIFNQTADNDQPDEGPVIAAPTEEISALSGRADGQIAALRKEQETALAGLPSVQAKWEASLCGPDAAARKGVPKDVLSIADVPESKRTKQQALVLARYFGSIAPELKPLRDKIAALEKSRPAIPSLPVMAELPLANRRVTRVLRKGNFLDPAETVLPGVPASLPAFPAGSSPDRLGLARWLTDRRNPLTARVAVNRLWAQIFASGLVETEEDFGTQGDPPSHPELLDWLAIFYQDSGWDTKALLRLIVTSATYRQSSKLTPELRERDPRNRLLARAPRMRLEAEMVRDQAMALSGLLSRKIGGPSVFPPQPDGLWQAAFNGQRTWATSEGADRYRRGLYTFWRRTVPYPSMAAFDAPSREICAIKRVRTNTPLQAFVTMNDPVYVETAQALARRIVREGGSSVRTRVRYGLELCLCRPPEPDQVEPLVALFDAEFERFRTDSAAAASLSGRAPSGLPAGTSLAELAAWTTVANVLLNLDGVLTKG